MQNIIDFPSMKAENLQILHEGLGTYILGEKIIQFEFTNIAFLLVGQIKDEAPFFQIYFRETMSDEENLPLRFYFDDCQEEYEFDAKDFTKFYEKINTVISLAGLEFLEPNTSDFAEKKQIYLYENEADFMLYLNKFVNGSLDKKGFGVEILAIDNEEEYKKFIAGLTSKNEEEIEMPKSFPYRFLRKTDFFQADDFMAALRGIGVLCKIYLEK